MLEEFSTLSFCIPLVWLASIAKEEIFLGYAGIYCIVQVSNDDCPAYFKRAIFGAINVKPSLSRLRSLILVSLCIPVTAYLPL